MTELTANIPVLLCIIYLVVSLCIGLAPGIVKQDRQAKGFVATDGGMNVTLLFFVLGASIFSSLAFLGAPALAYSRGAIAYGIVAAGIVGAVPFFFLGPAVRKAGLSKNHITQGDFFGDRYQSRLLPILFAVFALIVSAPYLVFQIKGAGLVFETISGGAIPYWVGTSLTYTVVGTYVLVSGVRGVGWTNAMQGLFMACVALYIGWYFPTIEHGGVGEMFDKISSSDSSGLLWGAGKAVARDQMAWANYSTTVVVIGLGFTCWPHLFIKCFAADSQNSLRRTAALMPLYAILMFPLLFVGYSAVLDPNPISTPDSLIPSLLIGSQLPTFIIGGIAAAILAASMSSGDTILHAAGSIVVHDGIKHIASIKPKHEVRFMRIVIVVLLTICYMSALKTDQSIAQIYLASFGFVSQIFPATVAACYWERSSKVGVITALLVGMAISFFFLIRPELKPFPFHEGFYGLLFNSFFLISFSYLFPDRELANHK